MMDVPVARRVANPSWVNARTVLGLLLFCLAFLGGQRVLTQAQATAAIWSATRPLAQGTRLAPEDLVAVEVRLPADQMTLYLGAEHPFDGAILTRAVGRGELIPASWLSEGAPAESGRTLTIPVSPEHANGGSLRPGDQIDIFATFAEGRAAACTVLIGGAVEVVDVVTAGGLVVEDESQVGVTVAITAEGAARMALAVRTAEIDIARVTGSAGTPPPTTVCAEDLT
jgi:Flp pilus assembly protein CpaB